MRIETMNDWRRWSYRQSRHHERFVRYVEGLARKLRCQECGGRGDYVDEYIDFGGSECGALMYPRYEQCGWCEGTGLVTPHLRSVWLRCKREEKSRKANLQRARTP